MKIGELAQSAPTQSAQYTAETLGYYGRLAPHHEPTSRWALAGRARRRRSPGAACQHPWISSPNPVQDGHRI